MKQGEPAPKGVLSVELAGADDVDDLVRLAAAREAHEAQWTGQPASQPEVIAERVRAALLGERPFAEALIARRGGRAVGAAWFGTLFPGDRFQPAVFLKDMFVLEADRGGGAGRAMLARLRRIARGRGADRVELHVHPDNGDARRFYAREGLKEPERLVVRVDLDP